MICDFGSISGAKNIPRARLCVRLSFRQALVPSLFVLELAFDELLPFAPLYGISYGIKGTSIALYSLYFN